MEKRTRKLLQKELVFSSKYVLLEFSRKVSIIFSSQTLIAGKKCFENPSLVCLTLIRWFCCQLVQSQERVRGLEASSQQAQATHQQEMANVRCLMAMPYNICGSIWYYVPLYYDCFEHVLRHIWECHKHQLWNIITKNSYIYAIILNIIMYYISE